VAVSPDGRYLAAGFFDGRLKVFNPRTGSLRFTLSGHRDRIRGCAFSPDGSQILSGSNDSTLRIWDSRNGSLRYSIEAHDGAVSACAFSKNGRRFFSASEDNFLILWDALTGEKICAYPVGAPALSAAWHRDGRRIAVGDATGKVHLLELC
jgi:WD40 repeat protein